MEITWHERTVPTGDVELRVRSAGDPNHPTVVLVHGYPDSCVVWDDVAARLVDRHHVVAYDVRGMGRSSAPRGPRPYVLDRLIADLDAVLDAVSPERPVHLVGHDWGSIQCWEAVSDPARRNRLASYTSLSGPSLDHIGEWVRARVRRPTARGIAQLLNQGLRSTYIAFFQLPLVSTEIWRLGADRAFRRWLRTVERVPVDAGHPGPTLAADGRAGVALYRANMGRRATRPRPRTTTVPVQLIELAHDRYVTDALNDGVERWVPDLVRRRIDAGHWVPRTHPAEVADLIADHVAVTEGASSNRG